MTNTPGQPEDFEFPGEFVPSPRSKDCDKHAGGWGKPMTDFEYIWYGNKSEDDYPDDACDPYYHKSAQIDNLQVNATCGKASVTNFVGATVTISGLCAAGSFSSQSKLFDIPHPSKKDKRLRHGCLEGPELGVYVRGHLKDTNVIELPDYWSDLVDPESITVSLTQIGSSQDLIVDSIDWGRQVKVRSGNGTNINCYYIVNAMRKDIPVLEVEVDA
tara:strand:- start:41 stop:688 length:648 start_codon:yes stop_codon:yes gene_type:complete